MKLRYPIIGAILILILTPILSSNSYTYELINVLGILFVACIGLIIYLIVVRIFRTIKSLAMKSSTQNRKLQNIDRALNEIESTLDAMTEAGQENGNITPIWSATPKDRK